MISVLFMDVDGTLTDGKIYMGERGELIKAFSIKDGYGINVILPEKGIIPIIITTRKSKILEKRCEELGITRIYQGVRDKTHKVKECIHEYAKKNDLQMGLSDVAYIGDDMGDFDCMKMIRDSGGIIGCPADAAMKIKEISDYICKHNGGEGAVREFIEWLIEK